MGQPFVVQLPNRPGELSHLAKGLCAKGVNVVQIQGSTAGELACALLYTDNDDITAEVLEGMGYSFITGSTLIVDIEDTPCALGVVTGKLAHAGVNLTGCCVLTRQGGLAKWSLSVDHEDVAREALGLPPVTDATA